jgi:hypothetical protein
VPFIRYARDKKGYECTCVMHAYRPPNGPQRVRVLYLFRSPAHLKVGRQALDEEVVEALEHTHPDISFDWMALRKEPRVMQTERPERFDRPGRRSPGEGGWERSGRGKDRRNERPLAPPRPPAEAPVVDDTTVLGRAVGASQAARLRQRYLEIGNRIARRARTPEDRDRLNAQLLRLNPDDWADEAAVRAGAGSIDAGWDAITAELPGRRRGRRGGRGRSDGPPRSLEGASVPSGIMDEEGNADAHDEFREAAASSRDADEPRDDGPDGPGADPDDPAAITTEAVGTEADDDTEPAPGFPRAD